MSEKTLLDDWFKKSDGKWFHLAVTQDEKGDKRTYIDGKLEGMICTRSNTD